MKTKEATELIKQNRAELQTLVKQNLFADINFKIN